MALLDHVQERFKITCAVCLGSEEILDAPKGELIQKIISLGWAESPEGLPICPSCLAQEPENPE